VNQPGPLRHNRDRTSPHENWAVDDPPQRKPAKAERAIEAVPVRPPLREPTPIKIAPVAPSIPSAIQAYWNNRPCWMCGKLGSCGHREYEVALAYVAADPARVGEPGGG
jgi:hypothetical protein